MKRSAAALVVVLALGIATPAATARTANRWPRLQERAFLASCKITSHGRVAVCRCALTWLERRYTYRQIAAIFLHDKTRMARIVVRAVLACRR